MIQFIQPGVSVFIGFALTAYGMLHTATHVPGRQSMQSFWSALPSLISVLVFVLGITVAATGLGLLASGVLGVRRRWHQVRQIFGGRSQIDDDEDGYGERLVCPPA